MSVKKEDVEAFLDGNPAFAQEYFNKSLSPAAMAKVSGLPEAKVDFGLYRELSQVEESNFLFEMIKDMQENVNMERVEIGRAHV